MQITDSLSVRLAHKVNDRKIFSIVSLSVKIIINYSILVLLSSILANDEFAHKETIESSFFTLIPCKLERNLSLREEWMYLSNNKYTSF